MVDQSASLAISPPTIVRISCPKTNANSNSELNPIQVEVSHGTQRVRARGPRFDRTIHYMSTSDVVENTRDSQDQQTQRQPRVHFKSTPNVDLIEPPGPFRPPGDLARKITSNPEIFPQEKEKVDRSNYNISSGLSSQSSNPTVYIENNVTTNTTNPFVPNYEDVSQKIQTSVEPEIICPRQIVPQTSDSYTSTSTLVKAGDKTVDVTDFDPIKSPPEVESHQNPISNSSSYVFIESNCPSEPQPVDISYFDPISSQSPDTPTSNSPKSPQTPPIPAIPPPPPQPHKRTPRTSESRTSECDVYFPQTTQPRTSTLSNQLSPSASSSGFDAGPVGISSRQGIDIPAGDASSDRPGSPTSPDAVGIFVMSDLNLEEERPEDNET